MLDLQGHRGARGLLPENTIPAFEKALALEVTTLEMDVVITKDSQVVVSHEPWFSGTICSKPSGEPIPHDNEKSYKIFEMTYEEVKRFDCGLRGNPRFPRQEKVAVHKPLLKDVIAFAEAYARQPDQPAILYNIETKSTPAGDNVFHPDPATFTQLLIEVLEETAILNRATIQSFDPRTLQVARSLKPDLSLALLVGDHDTFDFAGHIEHLGFTPAIYSPYYKLVDKALVDAAHAHDMLVIPWTINTLEEMQALVDLGVDGIITDYPDISQKLVSGKN
ncbi:MAG: glycerophosphodiester phosphodiesterase [Bacteroidota bacterium]